MFSFPHFIFHQLFSMEVSSPARAAPVLVGYWCVLRSKVLPRWGSWSMDLRSASPKRYRICINPPKRSHILASKRTPRLEGVDWGQGTRPEHIKYTETLQMHRPNRDKSWQGIRFAGKELPGRKAIGLNSSSAPDWLNASVSQSLHLQTGE